MIGASTAVSTTDATRTHMIPVRSGSPAMRLRTAVTRCVTGFTSTKRCSTTGIVDGSTKMFDANVSGMSTSIDVPSGEFGLVVGEPATFRFFSSPVRKQDKPGDLLDSWGESELAETDSLEALLPRDETIEDDFVPVRFHSHITELGVFELWCQSTKSANRWKLEFSVRKDAEK